MAYCVYTDIENRLGTTLGSTILNTLITSADRQIVAWLAAEFIAAPSSDDILTEASIELTCAMVKQRSAHTGERPDSFQTGPQTTRNRVLEEIAEHKATARSLVDQYIRKTMNVDAQTDGDAEGTVVRTDHLMKNMQLDQAVQKEYHDKADDYGTEDDDE